MPSEPCQCALCTRSRKFDDMCNGLSPAQLGFFCVLHADLVEAEFDLEVANAIIDGSWPNADETIKHRREKHDAPKAQAPSGNQVADPSL